MVCELMVPPTVKICAKYAGSRRNSPETKKRVAGILLSTKYFMAAGSLTMPSSMVRNTTRSVVSTCVIFTAIPFTGTIGAMNEVGKPGGSVVVVVLVVVVVVLVVVVVAGAEVVVATGVELTVVSLEAELLEQAVATNARLPKIKRKTREGAKI